MEATDREMFTPCDICKKYQSQGYSGPDAFCRGCRHNRTAIAWLQQQLASLRKTAEALAGDPVCVEPVVTRNIPGLAPAEEIPTPTVRLKPSACLHTTARFSQSQGFICVDCGDVGLYKNDATLYQALYTRVTREEA